MQGRGLGCDLAAPSDAARGTMSGARLALQRGRCSPQGLEAFFLEFPQAAWPLCW